MYILVLGCFFMFIFEKIMNMHIGLIGGICIKSKLLDISFGIADCRDDGVENLLRKGLIKSRRINVTENPNAKPENFICR